jgi:hypothetical protein
VGTGDRPEDHNLTISNVALAARVEPKKQPPDDRLGSHYCLRAFFRITHWRFLEEQRRFTLLEG